MGHPLRRIAGQPKRRILGQPQQALIRRPLGQKNQQTAVYNGGHWATFHDCNSLVPKNNGTWQVKEINIMEVRTLISLKQKGWSNRKIAAHIKVNRKTVDSYISRFKVLDLSCEELLQL